MRRRQLLRKTGTASAGVAGLAGVAGAREPTHINWEFDDGREETIPMAEFDRRSDTPGLADLEQQDETGCCCCPNVERCYRCIVCAC